MSDDKASKTLIKLFAASVANKKLKEQREITERWLRRKKKFIKHGLASVTG